MTNRAAFRRRDAVAISFEQRVARHEQAELAELYGKRSPLVHKLHPVKRELGTSDVGLTPMPNPVHEMQRRAEEAARKIAFDYAAHHWPNGMKCPASRTEAILAGHIQPTDHVPEHYKHVLERRSELPEGPGGLASWKLAKS